MRDGGSMNNVIEQGDIIFADAEPHSGHEIGGHNPQEKNIRRPFVVISNKSFNRVSKLAFCIPLTHEIYENRPGFIPYVDLKNKIRGSLIIFNPVVYDLTSRNAEVIGHIQDDKLLKKLIAYMKECF